MKRKIIGIFVSVVLICTLIPLQTIAIQIDEVKTPTINHYLSNFKILEDDDPEGQDGPDDNMDYYYLFCGFGLLLVMPFGIIHIIKNIGKPGKLIANLIGEFGASAFVVVAALEAFDYKDVDGDGY